MAAGLAVLAALVLQQRGKTRKGGSPLVVLSLFSGRPFSAGLAAQLVLGLLSGLFFLCWTLFMQHGLGLSPSRAAVGFLLFTVAEIGGSWLAWPAVARHQRRVPQAGALVAAVALAVFRLLAAAYGTHLPMTVMALPVLALGLGLGMIGAPLTDLTLGRVGDAHAASATRTPDRLPGCSTPPTTSASRWAPCSPGWSSSPATRPQPPAASPSSVPSPRRSRT
jgi:hypothetical protein